MFKVPVLLILYNRIEETHTVFQVLRTVQPTQLYVAGDGPVPDTPLDRKRVYQTRSVIQPEWPCQLHTFWQEKHLGKPHMIDAALKWFFHEVPEGIVLFEDTVPSYDFFPYCEELLDRYRSNEHIFTIGGYYFHHKSRKRYNKRIKKGKSSYYFSAYATTWGFATWRDRWQGFSLEHDNDCQDFQILLERYFDKKKEKKYWLKWYNILKKKNLQLFDYQYNFHLWSREGLCITPSVNLVANVDFKKNRKRRVRRLLGNSSPIVPLQHPIDMSRDIKADRHSFKKYYKKAFFAVFAKWLSANVLLLGDE